MFFTNRRALSGLLLFFGVLYTQAWAANEDQGKTKECGSVTSSTVSARIGDIRLRITEWMNINKVFKDINCGKGNQTVPAKFPNGKGYDVTKFRDQTAVISTTVSITNTGKEPLTFSLLLYFAVKLKIEGIDQFVGFEDKKPVVWTIHPGKTKKFLLSAYQDIDDSNVDVRDGRYSFYPTLSIIGYNGKTGKEFDVFPVFVTVTTPYYLK